MGGQGDRKAAMDRLGASVFLCSRLLTLPAPTEAGQDEAAEPLPRCPRQGLRAPALGSALHTMNHSVHVNWNYQS